MKPIHLLLIAGGALLLLRKRAVAQPIHTAPGKQAYELDPVTVYAPAEKPIQFPTSFQYEEMPELPRGRSEDLIDRIWNVAPDWLKVGQGQI